MNTELDSMLLLFNDKLCSGKLIMRFWNIFKPKYEDKQIS